MQNQHGIIAPRSDVQRWASSDRQRRQSRFDTEIAVNPQGGAYRTRAEDRGVDPRFADGSDRAWSVLRGRVPACLFRERLLRRNECGRLADRCGSGRHRSSRDDDRPADGG